MMDSDCIFLEDSEDHLILLHREIHFDGDFQKMIEYYENEGIGCHVSIALERIRQLSIYETSSEQDLAPQLLTEYEMEVVAEGRRLYESLEEQLEAEGLEQKISALILAKQEDAEEQIESVVSEGRPMVPYLVDLLGSEGFRRSEFPGFGLAPERAARALGAIGGSEVVIPLFEQISRGGFDMEETAMSALAQVGNDARDFLLQVVQAKPFTEDNERALMALASFGSDEVIQRVCNKLKATEEGNPVFREYLELICD